jgi:hypothetical protein
LSNPFTVIAADLRRAVEQSEPMLEKMNAADTAMRPHPGKWSKKEILGHLLDSASNNHQRFVRAALAGNLVFPGYEQARLVDLQHFQELEWKFLVEFWAAYNRFLAHVISNLPPESAAATCAIGENPQATLEWLAKDYVTHLKHHLNQILEKCVQNNVR